jgi:hypothetical protein
MTPISKAFLSNVTPIPLFLNVDDPEQTGSSWVWHSADRLYFNIADLPGYWGVRKFLMPFQGLLRVAGVNEVRDQIAPDLPISSADAQLTRMRTKFDKMRRDGILTDVKFKTDAGEEFAAHRAFLATTSEHFWDMFCGSFGESGAATADNPKVVPVTERPSECVKFIIGDYLN